MVVGGPRDADAARLAHRLQPGGDVHAVAEDVAAIDDDIADVDANPELDPVVIGDTGIGLQHGTLDRHGAGHGVHDAGEFHQQSIPGSMHNPAVVPCDAGVDTLASVRLQRRMGANVVDTHQPAVAGDVRCQDGRQPTFGAWRCYGLRHGVDRLSSCACPGIVPYPSRSEQR